MARENTRYMSINLTKDQHKRLLKLAVACGMNPNSLLRLISERCVPADVERMLERT
jgi:phage terminase small subunit